MSAATEFMIGHSADDATERKQEVRKIAWALLAALLLHLLVGSFLAAFNGWFSPSSPLEEDRPMELNIVEMPPPEPKVEVKRNPMFHETDPAKETVEQPKEKTFESNANSQAASELPAAGSLPIPSQLGVDRPTADLETHQATLAQPGAAPQPTIRPQEKPTPSVAPTAAPTPTPADQLAMLLRATPTPAVQPSATPQEVRSNYQPMKQQKRMTGAISNHGAASVNAVGTPLGRYQKMLYDAVGSRWYSYMQQSDLASIGTAHVVFSVDRSGRVRNLKVVQNTSNESFANVCLRSVLEVRLPPIPEDVAAALPSEGLEEEMSFTMYAN
jgi:outer membrane biosynthesis protein TonB